MSNNYLSSDRRGQIVAMLCEGMGIRPTERVVNAHRDTIMRLGRDVGEGYVKLHNQLFVNLRPKRLELDEAWSFVHTKQGNLQEDDPRDWGDQYSFIAMDSDTKAILAYHVGKRTKANTIGFALDLSTRILTQPQITSDGFDSYIDAINIAFGPDIDYAMLIKQYVAQCSVEASERYQPSKPVVTEKRVISGEPDEEFINTAFVERQNLTLRMLTRRFNRLTNAHSKTLRNHRAAMDMYVGYYNLCWEHSTLKQTPAMAAGVTDHVWTVEELAKECLFLGNPLYPPERPGHERYAEFLKDRARERERARKALRGRP